MDKLSIDKQEDAIVEVPPTSAGMSELMTLAAQTGSAVAIILALTFLIYALAALVKACSG